MKKKVRHKCSNMGFSPPARGFPLFLVRWRCGGAPRGRWRECSPPCDKVAEREVRVRDRWAVHWVFWFEVKVWSGCRCGLGACSGGNGGGSGDGWVRAGSLPQLFVLGPPPSLPAFTPREALSEDPNFQKKRKNCRTLGIFQPLSMGTR